LRAIFDRADVDKSGEISTQEAIQAVQSDDEFAEMMGFDGVTKIQSPDDRSDLDFAVAMLDADGNEKVSWGEFREAFLGPLTEEPEDPFEEYLNVRVSVENELELDVVAATTSTRWRAARESTRRVREPRSFRDGVVSRAGLRGLPRDRFRSSRQK
jgi:hypothetical protein